MRYLLFYLVLLLPVSLHAQDVASVCQQINMLNQQITIGAISKTAAKKQFRNLLNQLPKAQTDGQAWVFPLNNYTFNAIGGNRGNGYNDRGYNYFDGNKHTAHPAHDIFITDRNQDCFDDNTKQPVSVLAVADGIVIACSNQWNNQSNLRGGRFIWLYHPALNLITYYAHNKQVMVQPGDAVRRGQRIAEVGRTGFNAFKKRSPTHLHFGAYRLVDGLPVPFNPYNILTKAKLQ